MIISSKIACPSRSWILLVALIIPSAAFPQKYSVENFSITFRDPARGNRKIPVDIFYPGNLPVSSDSQCISIASKHPVIVFGHGYLISGKYYRHIVDMLVPEGYILAFPSSESGMWPSHKALAKDLAFVLADFDRLGNDPTSSLFGRMDTLKVLMGHSMGGGAAFVAASYGNDADVIVGLSPHETKPSAAAAASKLSIPTLIFSGTSDCITPSEKYHLPIYNSSKGNEKTFILIKGGTHCQMGVSHPNCSFGEKIAGCKGPAISLDKQLKILSSYIQPWLRFHLGKDENSARYFNSELESDTAVSYLRSRPVGRLN